MTRLRIPGIVCIALALAGPSVFTAQTKPATTPATTPSSTKPTTPMPKQTKLKPVDINTASEDDLVLIGVDRAAAKKIVQARPFRSKADLVAKQLLTREQYDKVKDMLVAKQPPKK